MDGVLVAEGGARTPSEHLQGTLEQSTDPWNAHIGLCSEPSTHSRMWPAFAHTQLGLAPSSIKRTHSCMQDSLQRLRIYWSSVGLPNVSRALRAAVLIWCTVWFVKSWSKLAVSLPAVYRLPGTVSPHLNSHWSPGVAHIFRACMNMNMQCGAHISLPNSFNCCIIPAYPLSFLGPRYILVQFGSICRVEDESLEGLIFSEK